MHMPRFAHIASVNRSMPDPELTAAAAQPKGCKQDWQIITSAVSRKTATGPHKVLQQTTAASPALC